MKELPKDWKPKSPEHAVKCLQSWVEQGERRMSVHRKYNEEDGPKGLYLAALVQGIKGVLKVWNQWKVSGPPTDHFDDGYEAAIGNAVTALAEEYAPWMIKAGMNVPGP